MSAIHHRQIFTTVKVRFPHNFVLVELERSLLLDPAGSEVVRRTPVGVRLTTKESIVVLRLAEAQALGDAVLAAVELAQKEVDEDGDGL